jgi:hypothetical protein
LSPELGVPIEALVLVAVQNFIREPPEASATGKIKALATLGKSFVY